MKISTLSLEFTFVNLDQLVPNKFFMMFIKFILDKKYVGSDI